MGQLQSASQAVTSQVNGLKEQMKSTSEKNELIAADVRMILSLLKERK